MKNAVLSMCCAEACFHRVPIFVAVRGVFVAQFRGKGDVT